MKNFKQIILTIAAALLFTTTASAAEKCEGIEAGTKAYNENDFEQAIDEWRTCVDEGIVNADLYYNLGNAYYRSGKLGFAIFYYKSALRLHPSDDDIQPLLQMPHFHPGVLHADQDIAQVHSCLEGHPKISKKACHEKICHYCQNFCRDHQSKGRHRPVNELSQQQGEKSPGQAGLQADMALRDRRSRFGG